MSIDCQQMDDLMMDYLYQELSSDQRATFQQHVDGCERCGHELARFQGVRSAVSNLADAEPPVAVSAQLMAAAAKAVAPTPAQRFWTWLSALMAPMRAHPAMASIAALMLVIGIGGFLARRGFQGKDSQEKGAAMDDRRAESASAGAPAASPTMAAVAPSPSPAAEADFEAAAAAGNGQRLEEQKQFERDLAAANSQGVIVQGDKPRDGFADSNTDPDRVARLRSAPVPDATKRKAAAGADSKDTWAEDDSLDFRKNDPSTGTKADDRFAAPPPKMPAPEPMAKTTAQKPVKEAGRTAPGGGAPSAASPPMDESDGDIAGERETVPIMAPPPAAAGPVATDGMIRGSAGGSTPPTSTVNTPGGIAPTAPRPPTDKAPAQKKVTVTGKVAASPPVTNPMNLRDPKPMTPSQMQSSADTKRRRGDCVGALPMYDEILRKYPSYLGRTAVVAGREQCLSELEGRASRTKKSGGSSATGKAKAAPLPAPARADDAAESVK